MMEAELGDTGRKITIELDYTHFVKPRGWCLVAQFVLGLLAICCTGSATFSTQIYFLVITIIVFLGSLALSLLHLYFVEFNNRGKIAEFLYTSLFCFLYFVAFVAQVADLKGFESQNYVHRWNAQVAAGVFGAISDVTLAVSLYFMYPGAKMAYQEIQENKT